MYDDCDDDHGDGDAADAADGDDDGDGDDDYLEVAATAADPFKASGGVCVVGAGECAWLRVADLKFWRSEWLCSVLKF